MTTAINVSNVSKIATAPVSGDITMEITKGTLLAKSRKICRVDSVASFDEQLAPILPLSYHLKFLLASRSAYCFTSIIIFRGDT